MRIFNWIAAMVFVPLFVSIAIGPELTLEDLKERSDAVIRGRVARIEYHSNKEQTIVFTFAKVKVSEVVRGNIAEDTINVILLGGILGDKITVVVEEAKLKEGEEILAFVHKNKKGKRHYRVTGQSQGKFSIITDTATGAQKAVRDVNKGLLTKRSNEHVPENLENLIQAIRN